MVNIFFINHPQPFSHIIKIFDLRGYNGMGGTSYLFLYLMVRNQRFRGSVKVFGVFLMSGCVSLSIILEYVNIRFA